MSDKVIVTLLGAAVIAWIVWYFYLPPKKKSGKDRK